MMEVSWIALLVSAAVLLALVLLAFTCLDCWNKSPLVFIEQTRGASEEYIPSTQFRVIHPSQSASMMNSIPTSLLSPHQSSINTGSHQRHPSYAPTETESNPSYENPVHGPEYNESDAEDNGYIVVLPEPDVPPTSPSRASSVSSDTQHDYENVVKSGSESESSSQPRSGDYLNVDPLTRSPSTPELSSQSDSDDYDTSYVNQPPMIGN